MKYIVAKLSLRFFTSRLFLSFCTKTFEGIIYYLGIVRYIMYVVKTVHLYIQKISTFTTRQLFPRSGILFGLVW